MGAKRQQGGWYQRFLFPEREDGPRHGEPGEGGTGAGSREESQARTALAPARALTERLMELDGWIRRRLRCMRLKQCKRTKTIADFLSRLGVPRRNAWITALSGKGWWRLARSPSVMHAMTNQWFESLRLLNLVHRYERLQA